MAVIAVVTLATLLAVNAHQNPSAEVQARKAVPITPVAASALARARSAEGDSRMPEAIKLYREAAAAGSGEAAKRLGDIYWTGMPGVERDLAESLRWYRVAQDRGEEVAQAVRLR